MILLNKFIANYISYSDVILIYDIIVGKRFIFKNKEIFRHEGNFIMIANVNKKEYIMYNSSRSYSLNASNIYRIKNERVRIEINNDSCYLKVKDNNYFKVCIDGKLYVSSVVGYQFYRNYAPDKFIDFVSPGTHVNYDNVRVSSYDIPLKNLIKKYSEARYDKNLPYY